MWHIFLFASMTKNSRGCSESLWFLMWFQPVKSDMDQAYFVGRMSVWHKFSFQWTLFLATFIAELCTYYFRMTSHECWDIPNCWKIYCLMKKYVHANKKIIKALHHWPFVRGNHWWPVVSQHKSLVIWKDFLWHDVIMILLFGVRVSAATVMH